MRESIRGRTRLRIGSRSGLDGAGVLLWWSQSSFPPLDVCKRAGLSPESALALVALPRRHEIFDGLDHRIERQADNRQQEENGENAGRIEICGALEQDVAEA